MRAKSVTLYSLPCVLGVAGFLVAAHQVAPSLEAIGLWDTSTKSELYSGIVLLSVIDYQSDAQHLKPLRSTR
jgi:hypothetical protein